MIIHSTVMSEYIRIIHWRTFESFIRLFEKFYNVLVKPGSNIAVIAVDCRRYMCSRLPQAICSQIHSFAGNHAGSQALINESSLLLLLSVVFSREAEALQKYGVSSNRQLLLATHFRLILTYYALINLTS